MSKLWCIALAFGDPNENTSLVGLSMQVDELQEVAVARAVAGVYRQTGTKLPFMGLNARELTREYLETVLKAMDEAEAKPPAVVQLVPPTAFQQAAQGLQQPIDHDQQRRLERIAHGLPPDEPAA